MVTFVPKVGSHEESPFEAASFVAGRCKGYDKNEEVDCLVFLSETGNVVAKYPLKNSRGAPTEFRVQST
jgi:hypothetical protein